MRAAKRDVKEENKKTICHIALPAISVRTPRIEFLEILQGKLVGVQYICYQTIKFVGFL